MGEEMWLIWGSKSNENVCLVTSAPGSPTLTFLCSAFVSLSQIPVQIQPPLSLSASSLLSQCSKVFLAVWRDSEALVQTGYSSAQGQCTGQGRVGGEGGRERRDGLSTAQLREGRQGQVLWVVCVYVRSAFVHMYVSCVDVSVLYSAAVEVNEQVQVSSLLTRSYRWTWHPLSLLLSP